MTTSDAPWLRRPVAWLALGTLLAAAARADEPPAPTQPASPEARISVLGGLLKLRPATEPAAADPEASHQFTRNLVVRGTDGKTGLQTLCVDAEGRILALVAPPRGYDAPAKDGFGEVHVFQADGTPLSHWKVDFHAHSINAAPDGRVFVAGDGRVARFDSAGQLETIIKLPHIATLLSDTEALKARAQSQIEAQQKSREKLVEQYQAQIQQLQAIPADQLSRTQATQLKQFETIVKQFQGADSQPNVDAIAQSIAGRMRIINSIAVSKQDVFVVCGESAGYGYAVWRMDHDFQNPKQILSGLAGCCGQMDVQVQGTDLLVAENTRHRFARYDRDGQPLGNWGRRGKETEPDCFGGCCNPMNLRVAGSGEIYTAESEGLVKRFAATGEYLGFVGRSKLTGGCKNVAVAVSPDGQQVYFCDQPGSQIVVMSKKS